MMWGLPTSQTAKLGHGSSVKGSQLRLLFIRVGIQCNEGLAFALLFVVLVRISLYFVQFHHASPAVGCKHISCSIIGRSLGRQNCKLFIQPKAGNNYLLAIYRPLAGSCCSLGLICTVVYHDARMNFFFSFFFKNGSF
jgi:hypothetical protein